MKIRYEAVSNVGLVRTNNEDMALVFGEYIRDNNIAFAFDLTPQMPFTAIVADGMGGMNGGEVASQMAAAAFNSFAESLTPDMSHDEVVMALKQWTRLCDRSIVERGQQDPSLLQMGTTLTGLLAFNNTLYVLNIGDSRTYRLRYDIFKQLTEDHSERQRTGNPSVPANLIYNALGTGTAFIDVKVMQLVEGDRYVVCSDGLSDMVSDEAIEQMSRNGDSARQYVQAALQGGGRDNVTVIVLDVEKE